MKIRVLCLTCAFVMLVFSIRCIPRSSSVLIKTSNFKIGVEKMVNIGNPMVRDKICTDTHTDSSGCTPPGHTLMCWQSGELIYMGTSKNIIRIAYREYLHDTARPAFYQDLTYDLDNSDIIQFKGLTIKIVEANNTFIRFITINQTEDLVPAPRQDISEKRYVTP